MLNQFDEIKKRALENLKDNLLFAFWSVVVCEIFIRMASTITIGIVAIFLECAFEYGIASIYLGIVRRKQTYFIQILDGFKDYLKNFLTYIYRTLIVLVFSLMLVVPGIIKAYSYSMVFYIRNDKQTLSPMECLNASEALMKGHKFELFKLQLSFIGWFFLVIVTMGFALIYVLPYYKTCKALLYEKLIDENNTKTYDEIIIE